MKQQTMTPDEIKRHTYRTMSEEAFTTQVIAMAKARGWLTAHFRPAMTKRGKWVTAVQGDGKGFPDLVLVRREVVRMSDTPDRCFHGVVIFAQPNIPCEFPGRVIFAELKSMRGALTEEQQEWIDTLKAAGQEVYVWRPSDIEEIERVLE